MSSTNVGLYEGRPLPTLKLFAPPQDPDTAYTNWRLEKYPQSKATRHGMLSFLRHRYSNYDSVASARQRHGLHHAHFRDQVNETIIEAFELRERSTYFSIYFKEV